MRIHLIPLIALTLSNFLHAENILRRGNGTEPHSLDPQISEGVPESNIQRDIFEGLISEDPEGNLIPGLAESWQISEDGKTYTLTLRAQNWSNGNPITADDVVFSLQRLVNPATGSKYSFIIYPIINAEEITQGIEKDLNQLGVKALNPQQIEITLKESTPYFLGLLAHTSTYPVPKAVVTEHGQNWTRPENIVSSGAFFLSEWRPQSHITLNKSPHYWDKENIKLDKVIYYPIEDQNSELARYRAGEIDITNEIPIDQLRWIKTNLANELKIHPYLGTYYYGINTRNAPLDNPKLREALSLAIDRNIIVEKITGAGEKASQHFVPEGIANYEHFKSNDEQLNREEQIKRAQALYKEAGYSKQNPLKIEILYNTSENHRKIAIAIAAMWKQVLGVEVEMINQEWKVYLQSRGTGQTQIFRAGWIGDYNDPYTFLEIFASNSDMNDIGYNDPEFDALLQQATQTQDLEQRAKYLAQAEKRLLDSHSIIPIYTYVSKRLVKPYVKGYQSNIMDHTPSKYLSIEK